MTKTQNPKRTLIVPSRDPEMTLMPSVTTLSTASVWPARLWKHTYLHTRTRGRVDTAGMGTAGWTGRTG